MNVLLTQFGELHEYGASVLEFTDMEQEAEQIVAAIHRTAMREFVSRKLITVWDWEIRTKHMFEDNRLEVIKDVIVLPLGKVNRLKGCGYTTRKEVYDIFVLYHIKLNNWSPEHHYSKMNYKFKE